MGGKRCEQQPVYIPAFSHYIHAKTIPAEATKKLPIFPTPAFEYLLQACGLGSYIKHSRICKRGWRQTSGCIHRARCVQELVSQILRVMSTDAVATSGGFPMKATASTDSVCPSAYDRCKMGQGSANSVDVSLLHCLEGVGDCLIEHQTRAKVAQDFGDRG